jgi:radical SAM superfamily enzyme YgiQ (UPF0313 family)
MKIVLLCPYELGRQPFGLAEPAAWLRGAGHEVVLLDLSIERLSPAALEASGLVCIYLAMHTATRIALEALPRVKRLAPAAHLCAYGLYAPVNEGTLRARGVETVLGGECEPALLSLANRLHDGHNGLEPGPVVSLGKVDFLPPDRRGLPPLERYARLIAPDGATRTMGFIEASRGCKHLCRHCPVVPVYGGRFRVVPVDVVMADIRAQVAAGARHISFGDPDFLNGPTHALRIVRALHAEHPGVGYDATIKIEHIIQHARLLPELARTGCVLVTSAVESVDDHVLTMLAKNHTGADFDRASRLLQQAGIALAPTFVAFTPWTTLDGYLELLHRVVDLRLVEGVSPVQLTIRLLVPAGSRLFELPGFADELEPFDPDMLGYPWRHRDHRVDELQAELARVAETAEADEAPRDTVFRDIWARAHRAAGRLPPALPRALGTPIPRHSEAWYCCAEPTSQQLAAF